MKRKILLDGPYGVQVVRLAPGCQEVPRCMTVGEATVEVPPSDWRQPYRSMLAFCGPKATRPANPGRWTAGTRWFG